jgi:crotonobetainyl-CoA:carnitine CoA-transferase CaiB-like acyl-CoA transferase
VNSPMQVHGVVKVSAKRAPEIGEHNEEILREVGFETSEIEGLRGGGALGTAPERAQGDLVSRAHGS